MRRPPPHLGPTARAHRRSRLVIDLAARIVLVAGEQVQLSAKDYELLVALAEDPERVFKKRTFSATSWGFRSLGGTRTLDSHPSRRWAGRTPRGLLCSAPDQRSDAQAPAFRSPQALDATPLLRMLQESIGRTSKAAILRHPIGVTLQHPLSRRNTCPRLRGRQERIGMVGGFRRVFRLDYILEFALLETRWKRRVSPL